MMKLIVALLFFSIMQVSASSFAQRISLSVKNTPLSKVFVKISQQSGYDFLVTNSLLRETTPITIEIKNGELEDVLKVIFKNQPLSYSIEDKVVIISKKVMQITEAENTSFNQLIDIHGKVTDSFGAGIPGATITIKGKKITVITAPDGSFTIKAEQNDYLVISFVGFISETIAVPNGGRFLTVVLKESINLLNETVVVGYGTQKKSDITGAISSVSSKDFTAGVNNSALQLLSGKASGVQVSQTSAAPGGGINIRIRGAGSINSSNEALIVIDGLPGASSTALSPEDIESIQILKDASAAAIYGSRAANGVVLITTKKGVKGKTKVSYNAYLGWQHASKHVDLLTGEEYMNIQNALAIDNGQSAIYTPGQISAIGNGTDWQNEIFRTAIATNHDLSFSGGAENSNYYLGLSFLDQQGVVLNSGLNKYNLRFNFNNNVSDKFKINVNANINRSITNSIYNSDGQSVLSVISTALKTDPTLSTQVDANGRYQVNPLSALENPLALINGFKINGIENRSYGTFMSEYSPIKSLTITGRLGADIQNLKSSNYQSTLTNLGLALNGAGSITQAENLHWIAEVFGKYNFNLNKDHTLDVLAGSTLEYFDNTSVYAYSQDFLSDVTETNLLQSGNGDTGDAVSSGKTVNQLNSFLARANYAFRNKYLVTASLRIDGTSRFSNENKYAAFPSIALGWKISEEPFFKNINGLDEFKLRTSYGRLGNQAIGNFATQQTFIAGGKAVFGNGLYQGAEPARLPNPNLRWETTEEYNFGMDFSFFKNRITGSVEYYIKNTKDQLFDKPVPASTGFSSTLINFGSLRNSGFDFSLQTKNLQGKFTWSSNLNLSTLKNRVKQLPSFIPQIITGSVGTFIPAFAIVKEGEPMFSYYGFQTKGLFQQGDNIAASAQPTAKPGQPIFVDQNGDNKIDALDRVVLGNPFPKLSGGFNNNFTFKNFSLDVLFVGSWGLKTLDANVWDALYPTTTSHNRIAKYYLDRWTPSNTTAQYPSGVNPTNYGGLYSINDYTVKDASFLRLKTVSLGYKVNAKSKVFNSIYLYATADNLLTITGLDGFDPEGNINSSSVLKANYNNYPLSRTIRFGANLGF